MLLLLARYWYHPGYTCPELCRRAGNVDLITDQTVTPYQFFVYNPCSRPEHEQARRSCSGSLSGPNPVWSEAESREGENLYEYDAGTGDYDSPYRSRPEHSKINPNV